MYTHTPDTRPLRLRVYPLWGGVLFAGSGELRQAGKPERAGNPPGTYIVLPATGSGAGHARRGGGGRDDGIGKMPGKREQGGGGR